MDAPVVLELRHSGRPAEHTAAAAMLPAAGAPLVIPLACLPVDVRARWLLADPHAPIGTRVAAAFAAGLDDAAFALLRSRPEPLMGPSALDAALDDWVKAEAARLRLPAKRGDVLVLAADGSWTSARSDAALGVADARALLSALAWPRWRGQVLAIDAAAPAGAPAANARPALPIVALSGSGAPREQMAAAVALLALDLSAPPAQGWPPWLRVGVDGVARAIARGEGPSPRAMLARRQAAGAAAIGALFAQSSPDPALAMAVCAPLLHSRRRHLLANLLDPLRHGADGAGAIAIAYGLTPEGMVAER